MYRKTIEIGLALSLVLVDMEMVLEIWLPEEIDGRSMAKVALMDLVGTSTSMEGALIFVYITILKKKSKKCM